MKDKAIVLLSGGMDSSTAAYWARDLGNLDIVSAVHFDYNQRGNQWEFAAAGMVASRLIVDPPIQIHRIPIRIPQFSPLVQKGSDLTPGREDAYGNPSTFVPGRNLIQLSMLVPYCYEYQAWTIVGGWVQQDVDYPDCRSDFLDQMAKTMTSAIGEVAEVRIAHPLISMHKSEIVALGDGLGVPWEYTRSCYADDYSPCGMCDSCLLRVAAFHANGMKDPIYSDGDWDAAFDKAAELGYIK